MIGTDDEGITFTPLTSLNSSVHTYGGSHPFTRNSKIASDFESLSVSTLVIDRINTANDKFPSGIYEVDKILAHRGYGADRQYKIQWVGYSSDDTTWEYRETFEDDVTWQDHE